MLLSDIHELVGLDVRSNHLAVSSGPSSSLSKTCRILGFGPDHNLLS